MRFLISLTVVMLLTSGAAYAQSDDNDQSLFESESTVDEPTDDQVDIPLGDDDGDNDSMTDPSLDDTGVEDVETENVTEETLCCQMSESERAGNELCVNITCP